MNSVLQFTVVVQAFALVLNLYTAKFLVGCSREIGKLEDTGEVKHLVDALACQRKYWVMIGIILIISIVFALSCCVMGWWPVRVGFTPTQNRGCESTTSPQAYRPSEPPPFAS